MHCSRRTEARTQCRGTFNWNSMTCRCDLCKSVCKAPTWFLSHRTWMAYPSFSCEAADMKSALAKGAGWNHSHSVALRQYEASYVYSRYVIAWWGRGGGIAGEGVRTLRSQLARRIRSWFCCSAHRGVHSFLDSKHSFSFAVQADVLSLAVCTLRSRYSLFGDGCKVNCELRRCDTERRVCERFWFIFFPRGEIQSGQTRASVREEVVFRAYHTCDALFWATRTHGRDTDGRGTARGYVLRKRRRSEKKKC